MALKLIIVSDFVCLYCYWLETLLDRLGEQLEIIHVPYQLTEPPGAPDRRMERSRPTSTIR